MKNEDKRNKKSKQKITYYQYELPKETGSDTSSSGRVSMTCLARDTGNIASEYNP